MAVEILVGVQVTDEVRYEEYRHYMVPILLRFGGRFMIDVKLKSVLKPVAARSINRMFSIRFPSEHALAGFFSDPEYVAVKERVFAASTGQVSTLGHYQVLEAEEQ